MEYIYEHYVELFNDSFDEEDYAYETTMMQRVLADAEHVEEHVLTNCRRHRKALGNVRSKRVAKFAWIS